MNNHHRNNDKTKWRQQWRFGRRDNIGKNAK